MRAWRSREPTPRSRNNFLGVNPRLGVQLCDALLADCQLQMQDQNVPEHEHLRAQAIASPARRRQFLAGRWLAKTLLSEALGGTPADWHITADPHSKPQVMGVGAHLSIAHSGDIVACALAETAVGVDVERINPRRSVEDIAQWVCSPQEQAALGALHHEEAMLLFNQFWTCKEARLKQLGLPFDMAALRAIGVCPSESASADAVTWQLVRQGCVLSLAGRGLGALQTRWPSDWIADQVRWHQYVEMGL